MKILGARLKIGRGHCKPLIHKHNKQYYIINHTNKQQKNSEQKSWKVEYN